MAEFTDTPSGTVVPRGWQRRDGSQCLIGDGVSIWDDERFPEVDGGDGCTTMCMYLIP